MTLSKNSKWQCITSSLLVIQSTALLLAIQLTIVAVEKQPYLGEVHTSAAFIPPMVELEDQVIRKLKSFVKENQIQDQVISRYISEWDLAKNEDFANHPLNSYHLFKRLVYEYREVEKTILQYNSSHQVLEYVRNLKGNFKQPTEVDVGGAAWAIARLQEVYDLQIEDLIQGKINGFQAYKGLEENDCLVFAQKSFDNLAFEMSELWTNQAIRILKKNNPTTKEHNKQIKNLEELLRRRKVMSELVTAMAKKSEKSLKGKFSGLGVPKSFEKFIYKAEEKHQQVDHVEKVFKLLCSGGKLKTIRTTIENRRKKSCYLSFGKPDKMEYAPFKVEEIHFKPDILLFHDVISTEEINELQTLAYPKMETARVKPYSNTEVKRSIARIGKSAWLKRTNYSLVEKLLWRIEAMSGLTTKYSEQLHILNYGVGGHYDLHIDFFDFGHLNDVQAGGSTVFPFLNIEVKPIKGTAIIWNNLYRNGRGNYRTLHASCPVLIGQKWISTLWLMEIGQEFRAPCSLDPKE